jgi:hypothetical protein
MKKLYFLSITLISISNFAQQATVVSGKNASGSGGSSSYTVGQIVYTTNTGTNGSLAQGVQQPFEISTLGTDEFPNVSLSAFPNPTSNALTLSLENYDTTNLRYELFDINGRLIKSNKLNGNQTQIDMTGNATGTYLLIINDKSKKLKTFKIIKQ